MCASVGFGFVFDWMTNTLEFFFSRFFFFFFLQVLMKNLIEVNVNYFGYSKRVRVKDLVQPFIFVWLTKRLDFFPLCIYSINGNLDRSKCGLLSTLEWKNAVKESFDLTASSNVVEYISFSLLCLRKYRSIVFFRDIVIGQAPHRVYILFRSHLTKGKKAFWYSYSKEG